MSQEEIDRKTKENIWDTNIQELCEAITAQCKKNDYSWSWVRNHACKYIDIRIDMRDGGYILKNRYGERIDLDKLKYQYRSEPEQT